MYLTMLKMFQPPCPWQITVSHAEICPKHVKSDEAVSSGHLHSANWFEETTFFETIFRPLQTVATDSTLRSVI